MMINEYYGPGSCVKDHMHGALEQGNITSATCAHDTCSHIVQRCCTVVVHDFGDKNQNVEAGNDTVLNARGYDVFR
jgi:hypothetical protein